MFNKLKTIEKVNPDPFLALAWSGKRFLALFTC
jgi:hypothetical protein